MLNQKIFENYICIELDFIFEISFYLTLYFYSSNIAKL